MKRLRNIVRGFLCRHCPRYKLWRICRAIGIKAYPWQRDFALRKRVPINELFGGRGNGKTMAVMLRLLMANPDSKTDSGWWYEICYDADFDSSDTRRVRWYADEYKRFARQCADQGIPVICFNFGSLYSLRR